MSNVLLIINEEAHARELSRVAEFLLQASDIRPVFFVEERMKPFGVQAKLKESSFETVTADDFTVAREVVEIASQDARRRWASSLLTFARTTIHKLPGIARRLLPDRLQNIAAVRAAIDRLPENLGRKYEPYLLMAGLRDQMLRRYALCEDVLSRGNFKTIVLCEDNIDLDTNVWIEAAHQHGIRCIIVPYTIANTVELTEAYVFTDYLQLEASAFNRRFARMFPKWRNEHKGRKFIRGHYAKIAAIEVLGLAPPNPWLLNSGSADVIAVESVAMRDYYSEAGIPPSQLVMTGTLVDDLMAAVTANAATLRRELLTAAGLPPDRPVLLCAFPPNQGVFNRPGCEFKNFDDMLRFWGECLGAVKGWNVIVARHPKTRPGDLDVLREFGLTLVEHDTASIIPLCDLYVACVSATIRWAIACGKPVINYDSYPLDFQDYPNIEAVVWTNTKAGFREHVAKLTGDAAHFAHLQAAQRREALRWGFHDGQSGQRLRALIAGEPFSEPAVDASLRRG
jgi:hypothetical protein